MARIQIFGSDEPSGQLETARNTFRTGPQNRHALVEQGGDGQVAVFKGGISKNITYIGRNQGSFLGPIHTRPLSPDSQPHLR